MDIFRLMKIYNILETTPPITVTSFFKSLLFQFEKLNNKTVRIFFFVLFRLFSAKRRFEEFFKINIRQDSLTQKIKELTLLTNLSTETKGLCLYSIKNSNLIFVSDLESMKYAFVTFSFDTDKDMLIRVEIEDALPILKEDVANAFLFNLDTLLGKEDGKENRRV